MLTTQLVRARCRNGRIEVPPLRPAQRKRLEKTAEQYLALAQAHLGQTRGELDAALDQVPHTATDYKVVSGLRKLVSDRCSFEAREDVDPPAIRRVLFGEAARVRMNATADFPRQRVVQAAATELGLSTEAVEAAMFADLKAEHRLTDFAPIGAPALLDSYEMAQKQAVLLRATRVVVTLRCVDPGGYRTLFNQLKFRRLLCRIERQGDGSYRLQIDGPMSLFQAVTKYGLQLACLLPVLQDLGTFKLNAQIRWRKDSAPLDFHLEGEPLGTPKHAEQPVRLADEVTRLYESFKRLETAWHVEPAEEILDLPGAGLCVPDLAFTHRETGARAYLEVMGYWSREAVWRRVELVQSGLPQHIIFAVSTRLRVSEEVLDTELPGELYVYKGTMSATAIAERLG